MDGNFYIVKYLPVHFWPTLKASHCVWSGLDFCRRDNFLMLVCSGSVFFTSPSASPPPPPTPQWICLILDAYHLGSES